MVEPRSSLMVRWRLETSPIRPPVDSAGPGSGVIIGRARGAEVGRSGPNSS